jgi:hypothetical protein
LPLEEPQLIRDVDPEAIVFHPDNTNTHEGVEFDKLVESIREHGIFSPPTVRVLPGHILQTLAGEGRVRAARKLGLPGIAVLSRGVVDDKTARVFMLIDNAIRNLDFVNECVGIAQLFRDGMSIKDLQKQFTPDASRPERILEQIGVGNFPQHIIEMIQTDIVQNNHKEFWNVTVFRQLLPLRVETKHHRVTESGVSEYTYGEVETAVKKLISGEIADATQLREYALKRRQAIFERLLNRRLQAAVKDELEKARIEVDQKHQLEIAGIKESQRKAFQREMKSLQEQIDSLEALNKKLASEVTKRPDKIEEKEQELFAATEQLRKQRIAFEDLRRKQEFEIGQAADKIKRGQQEEFAAKLEEYKQQLEAEFDESKRNLEAYYARKDEARQFKAQASFHSTTARMTELLSSTQQLGLMMLSSGVIQGFEWLSPPEIMALSAQIVASSQTLERLQQHLHHVAQEKQEYERSR